MSTKRDLIQINMKGTISNIIWKIDSTTSLISGVRDYGPAAGKLLPGDIITHLDAEDVSSMSCTEFASVAVAKGDEPRCFIVLRKCEKLWGSLPLWGIKYECFRDVNSKHSKRMSIRGKLGVTLSRSAAGPFSLFVQEVHKVSPLFGRIEVGDVITHLNGICLYNVSAEEFRNILVHNIKAKNGDTNVLTVVQLSSDKYFGKIGEKIKASRRWNPELLTNTHTSNKGPTTVVNSNNPQSHPDTEGNNMSAKKRKHDLSELNPSEIIGREGRASTSRKVNKHQTNSLAIKKELDSFSATPSKKTNCNISQSTTDKDATLTTHMILASNRKESQQAPKRLRSSQDRNIVNKDIHEKKYQEPMNDSGTERNKSARAQEKQSPASVSPRQLNLPSTLFYTPNSWSPISESTNESYRANIQQSPNSDLSEGQNDYGVVTNNFHPALTEADASATDPSPSEEQIRVAASDMFDRVLACACSEIAMILRQHHHDNEDVENARKKKLKQTVRFLREEHKIGRHCDCILDVTDNGKNLLHDPVINSHDCLERVMKFLAW